MNPQAWIGEVEALTFEFADDYELGEFILNECADFIEGAYDEGLTPQQTLNACLVLYRE